jgi:hypothetical protein
MALPPGGGVGPGGGRHPAGDRPLAQVEVEHEVRETERPGSDPSFGLPGEPPERPRVPRIEPGESHRVGEGAEEAGIEEDRAAGPTGALRPDEPFALGAKEPTLEPLELGGARER